MTILEWETWRCGCSILNDDGEIWLIAVARCRDHYDEARALIDGPLPREFDPQLGPVRIAG